MPVDTSIYGMMNTNRPKPGPMELAAQAYQIRNMVDTGRVNDLQRRKLEEDYAENDAFKKAVGRGASVQELMSVSPTRASAYEKTRTEAEQARANLAKTRGETLAKGIQTHRDALTAIDSPQLAVQWLAAGYQDEVIGPILQRMSGPLDQAVSRIPQDPKAFEDWKMRNMLGADKFVTELRERANALMVPGRQGQPATPNQPLIDVKQSIVSAGRAPAWDSERGIWITPPGATPTPGGAPAPLKPQNLPPRGSDVTALRKEFNDLPEVKNFRATVPIFNSAINAPDTRAGDIQFAYTIGKIFDPNSVVREGELKLVGEAATVLEKFQGELRTLTEGKGRLTPETRRQLLETAQARVSELEAAQTAARKTYENQARARNLPLDQIFVDMPKIGAIPVAPAPATAAPQFTPSQIDEELRRRKVLR